MTPLAHITLTSEAVRKLQTSPPMHTPTRRGRLNVSRLSRDPPRHGHELNSLEPLATWHDRCLRSTTDVH